MPVQVKGPADCTFCQQRKKKGLGPCGHHGGAGNSHRKGTKRDDGPAPKRNITTGVRVENGARTTAKVLLGQLEALRAKLDQKIAHVKELVEVL